MTPSEKQQLEKVQNTIKKLGITELQIDDTLFLLSMYLRYHWIKAYFFFLNMSCQWRNTSYVKSECDSTKRQTLRNFIHLYSYLFMYNNGYACKIQTTKNT